MKQLTKTLQNKVKRKKKNIAKQGEKEEKKDTPKMINKHSVTSHKICN